VLLSTKSGSCNPAVIRLDVIHERRRHTAELIRVKIWAKISKSEQKNVIFTTCFLGVPDHAEQKQIFFIYFFVNFFVSPMSNVTYEVAIT
jgi:hypothetical protein